MTRPKKAHLPFLFFLLTIVAQSHARPKADASATRQKEYDVCVYGATSAGVIAAYSAKKMGKSVVLISPDGHIGGLSSGGLGQTDIGNKHVITGLARDFYRRLGKEYNSFESWQFEPSKATAVFQAYIKEADIPVIRDRRIAKTTKDKARIVSVDLVPTYGKASAKLVIKAKMFIDCTYEGDLLALAGVSYSIGREDNRDYSETVNGYYLAEYHTKSGYHQFPDGMSPYKVPGDPASGLVWGISKGSPGTAGAGDHRVQTYNFRICLTDSAENRIPITRPADYDVTKYELLARLFKAQPNLRNINEYFIWSLMPNRKTDVNNRGAFSTDMIGMSDAWPEASFESRKVLFQQHLSYTKGMLYFMQNDPRVPDTLRNYVSRWGYPKDEYQKHGNFSPQLYIREGRRMIGEYVMTEKNCRGTEIVSDGVGMAAYTMDSHNCQRIVVNGMVKNEGNVEVGGFPPYPIAYRSIIPKKNECTNLLVPVSLSASHIAFGSIRMEPVFMVLGQSAALAATMAIDEKVAVQDISILDLQEKLAGDPYLNGELKDVLADDSDKLVTRGNWEKKFFNSVSYASSTMISTDKDATADFKIKVAKTGRYKLYFYRTGVRQLREADEYLFQVDHAGGTTSRTIHINDTPVSWRMIEVVNLEAGQDYNINIKAGKGTSVLVADAVLAVPQDLGYAD
jgi:hypothetical protein